MNGLLKLSFPTVQSPGANGGNGHRHRVRRQIHHKHRRAALKADTAVMLVENGMGVTEAIERCSTNTNDFYAMKTLRGSSNLPLYNHVLKGDEPVRPSAKRVKNAVVAIVALKKCSVLERELVRLATGMTDDAVTMLLNLSPDQLVATSKALGEDWVWEKMVVAAMSASEAPSEAPSEVVSESAIALNLE